MNRGKKKQKHPTKLARESSEDDSSSDEDELPAGASKISKDDYYKRSAEFIYWLRKKKKLYLEDLSCKEAKQHFKSFVKRWNRSKLAKGYYDGTLADQSNSSERTKHHWKFSDKLDNIEMGILRDSVVTMTNKKTQSKQEMKKPSSSVSTPKKKIIGPMMPPQSTYDRELTAEEQKREKKRKDKQFREHKNMVMDELLPKATGHEAKIEKRIAASHSRKAKEQSPELADSHLMGGSESIQSIVDKRKQRTDMIRSRKAEKAKEKIAAYEEREKAKMKELLELAKVAKSGQSMW